ncbi:hypothetical protein ACTD5D_09405 [Nocardia takedensis]|uniref:hypothetical protein n=1 Tax=Nocardia takedensis TaxID=259390 RepID=UPI003F7707E7
MTSSMTISTAALHGCVTPRAGEPEHYLVFRLSGQRHIDLDDRLRNLDYGRLLCELPEDRCRWVLHTAHPRPARVITWLPEQATITERLLYTAALTNLREHLPDTTLTAHAEDRTELARWALPTHST